MLLNRERAERKMITCHLEALVASSPANVLYTSDSFLNGQAFTLLPRDRNIEPALIAPISDPTPIVLMSPPWINDIRYYGEFYTTTKTAKEPLTEPERKMVKAQGSWDRTKEKNPATLLCNLLIERGITRGKIGVDESNLPHEHSFWQKLTNALPGLEGVPARNIFREIRMVKTPEEIDRIQEAARITEKAWESALEQTKEGMTEREFGEIYQHTIISEGGNVVSLGGMYGAPIAFGRRTAFVDIAQPSGYRLKKGDLIRFDGGCRYLGYYSDMARSAVLGQPNAKQQKYYNAIYKGEQLAIEMAKPGVKPSTIFNAAVEAVREEIPHYHRNHTGHGLGIEGYDPPLISPDVETPLEEGMVLCFETPYYEIGWAGLMVEDTAVIENKPRLLTRSSGELLPVRGL